MDAARLVYIIGLVVIGLAVISVVGFVLGVIPGVILAGILDAK